MRRQRKALERERERESERARESARERERENERGRARERKRERNRERQRTAHCIRPTYTDAPNGPFHIIHAIGSAGGLRITSTTGAEHGDEQEVRLGGVEVERVMAEGH